MASRHGTRESTWAAGTRHRLTIEEEVGQMLQARYFGDYRDFDGAPYEELRQQLRKYHVGSLAFNVHLGHSGLIRCFGHEAARVANQLQRDSELPLLLAADLERAASSRLREVPDFPWPMAIGADGEEREAERFGEIAAREARAIGVQWILAPVSDLNNNPVNPIINVRSFGEDPDRVGRLVAAYIRGAHKGGALGNRGQTGRFPT